jgi:EpsI family protein
MSTTRLAIALVLLACTGLLAHLLDTPSRGSGRAAQADSPRRRGDAAQAGLAQLPLQVGRWSGAEAPPLSPEIIRQLGADSLVNRVYTDRDLSQRNGESAEADRSDRSGESAEAGLPVQLYVAYYARQRPGVSIHSPLHCLPGTGWDVQSAGTVDLSAAGAAGEARRLIAQKNRDRALVLYWYDVHGRHVGSELASRFYLVGDRLTLGRNDASLVRVVVPANAGEAAAERRALAFIHDMLPHLSRLWGRG